MTRTLERARCGRPPAMGEEPRNKIVERRDSFKGGETRPLQSLPNTDMATTNMEHNYWMSIANTVHRHGDDEHDGTQLLDGRLQQGQHTCE